MASIHGRDNDESHSCGGCANAATDIAHALRFVSQRRWNAARAALLRAWECAKRDGDNRARAVCCRLLTEFHRVTGDASGARQFLQLALDAESSAWQLENCEFSSELLVAAAREFAANAEDENAFRLLESAACVKSYTKSLAASLKLTELPGEACRPGRSVHGPNPN